MALWDLYFCGQLLFFPRSITKHQTFAVSDQRCKDSRFRHLCSELEPNGRSVVDMFLGEINHIKLNDFDNESQLK